MATKTKKQQQRKSPFTPFLFIGVIIVVGIIILFFFKGQTAPESSQALAEAYTGEFPCADCSGIMTTLTLTKSSRNSQKGTYVLQELYEGKATAPFITKGPWKIAEGTPTAPHAAVLTLMQNTPSQSTYYLIAGASKLTLLNQKKEKIDSPFNESLTAASANNSQQSVVTKIANQLPSWLPTVTWSKPIASPQETFYGDFIGYQTTGMVMAKEASIPHFENQEFLHTLGFEPDTNLSADGPGSSSWGYTKEANGKKQFIIFSYYTRPSSNNPNEPLQFTCPCQTKLSIFISN